MYTQGIAFQSYTRGKTRVDEIVLHESVTHTRDEAVRVLVKKGCGVHFIVDQHGSVTKHVDVKSACAHSEGFGKPSLHNERSIAIEIVNPYYGGLAHKTDTVIDAVWAHKGRYVVPPLTQLESVWQLMLQHTYNPLFEVIEPGLVPLVFPGVQRSWKVGPRRFVWGRIKTHEVPGIMAHHRWYHADGLFPEHYCLLRSLGEPAQKAYDKTITAASSGKRATSIPP